jgi:hypothetical protein
MFYLENDAFTKSLVGPIFENQGLRVESEDNDLLGDTTDVDGRVTR